MDKNIIFNDPLNRKWLNLSDTNPNLVNELRPTLVSFLGFDLNKNPKIMGTGFVIAGDKKYAVVLTAKHVLEGLQRFQKPSKHTSSAVTEFFIPPNVSLKPSDLKIIWADQKNALMMNVVYAFYCERLDIACCIVVPQKGDQFLPVSVPLDCRTPSVGDTVHMISWGDVKYLETIAPRTQDGLGQTLEIKRSVNIRRGNVTEIHKGGTDMRKFPHFTTTIPAEPGMSGGFVFMPEDGDTVAACGVVSKDFSTNEARNSMLIAGESIISCTWPALGLSISESMPSNEGTPKITIYDMIKTGIIPAYRDSADHFEIIRLEEGNNYRVQRKAEQAF